MNTLLKVLAYVLWAVLWGLNWLIEITAKWLIGFAVVAMLCSNYDRIRPYIVAPTAQPTTQPSAQQITQGE